MKICSHAELYKCRPPGRGWDHTGLHRELLTHIARLQTQHSDELRSIGKQSAGESMESVVMKNRKGYGGKDLQKRKVLGLE